MLETVTYIFVALFGLLIGSFLNVCIYRMPRDKSIVWPGSACPECGNHIRWFDNIPLFSYLMLRGRCRKCDWDISHQYPLVEFLNAVLWLAVARKFGIWHEGVIYAAFVSALLVVTFIDLEHYIIPDSISITGIPLGFAASFVLSGVTWQHSLIGLLVGGGFFFIIATGYEKLTGREGLGGGDVKLIATIGAFLGIKGVIITILASSILGSLIGIGVILAKKGDMKTGIPFGPFLVIGALAALFLGDNFEVLFWGR